MSAPVCHDKARESLLGALAPWEPDGARTALTDLHGSMTYGELAAEARRWAVAMAACGVSAGDRVAVLAPPGRESLISLLAATELGAVWCGLDPRLRPDEIGPRLADLAPRLVMSFDTLFGRAPGPQIAGLVQAQGREIALVLMPEDAVGAVSDPGQALDAFLAGAGEPPHRPPAPPAGPAAPAIIVYTSGSSGAPKGAMLSAGAILDFCRRQNALWPVEPLRTLNFLPVSHAGSIVDLTMPTLVAGGCVVFQRKFDALESLHLIEREAVTFWGSVPSTFILQLAHPQFCEVGLGSVQLIAIEGAAVPEDLAAKLLPIAPIATNYGMTESCSAIAAMAPTRDLTELTASVGLPFGDAEVRIDAADGEIGEILVRSPRNLLGYWNAPEATEAAFTAEGFFRTGDLGVLLESGHLRLAGRKREMFKSGGYNVYPAEVERVIEMHPDVASVAVVPAPHPVWGEVGVAFVVSSGGPDRLTDALVALCGERLADYKRPKRFVLLDQMPLLPVGKIDRTALRARAAAEA